MKIPNGLKYYARNKKYCHLMPVVFYHFWCTAIQGKINFNLGKYYNTLHTHLSQTKFVCLEAWNCSQTLMHKNHQGWCYQANSEPVVLGCGAQCVSFAGSHAHHTSKCRTEFIQITVDVKCSLEFICLIF